ncbi:hypothetical protein JD844_014702 [Phrynosoma platyrhinos]|uniref:MAD homology 1 Dwarfin-type domain-containing protein n=1 Tax=Phrynosoma platyrhinos TaxID=52577 RepID=A0ABQ7SS16_PHRPL|nr:hypothetical protein JD844_014702 [Phrynosoma platyrhinos]
MFRSKRAGLVRRLWRSRLLPDGDGDGDGEPWKNPAVEGRGAPQQRREKEDEEEDEEDEEEEGEDQPRRRRPRPRARAREAAVRRSVEDAAALGAPPSGEEAASGAPALTCCLFKERESPDGSPASSPSPSPSGLEPELKAAAYALLKRLKDRALDHLLEAVESRGGMPGGSVRVNHHPLLIPGCLRMTSKNHWIYQIPRCPTLKRRLRTRPISLLENSQVGRHFNALNPSDLFGTFLKFNPQESCSSEIKFADLGNRK